MELSIEQALQQGVTAHKEGKLQEAERLYRAILQAQPLHPDANHNLGVLAASVNKAEAALPLFKTALEANPKIEQFWLSYIDALVKEKQNELAKQVIEQAKKRGVVGEKLNTLESQLTSETQTQNASFEILSQQQLNSLLEYYQDGQHGDAEKLAQSLTERFPNHQFAWKALGAILKQTGRISESLVASQKSVQLMPQDSEAHSNLGNTLGDLGRLDEAEAGYRQAIALTPDYAEAHRHLATMKRYDSQDEQYLKMQELYLDENVSEERLCHINFGLAKACEDLRDFQQAYAHYREGNALRKKLLNYEINQDVKLFNQIKSNYPPLSQNSLNSDNLVKNLAPIFIVGMPRSGTTLVEQIISSHPNVTGAGELPFARQFGELLAAGLSEVDTTSLMEFRESYLKKLQSVSKGSLIVTDKMPQNFLYLGLLAAAFPEAKIVHVKRNPAAVCWANYKQYFASKNIGFCWALEDIVSYHKLYENLMEFWGNSLSKRIYYLDYELLVENQESETRQLIDYLGLDWDVKCLSPQNNTRSVATASGMQIRRKVYRGSSQQWEKYKPFLDGALDDLQAP